MKTSLQRKLSRRERRVRQRIDPSNWIIARAEFVDAKGQALKTLTVAGVREVDGFWTRDELHMQNHQTGHQTYFSFSEVDYRTPVDDATFSKRALERGQ